MFRRCVHALSRRGPAVAAGIAAMLAAMLPLAPASASGGPFSQGVEVQPPADASDPPTTQLLAVACGGAGNCVAGGGYLDSVGRLRAFVARQSQGAWSKPLAVRLPAGAAAQPDALVDGLACVSAGHCYAVGGYVYDGSGDQKPFVAAESNGNWGRATTIRLPANAKAVAGAYLQAVTCTAAGFCEAAGGYLDKGGHFQAMAVAKPAGGRWRQAVEIAAPKDAAPDPEVSFLQIACPGGAGNCVMVGGYDLPAPGMNIRAMGAVEVKGAWRRAVRVTPPKDAKPADGGYWLNGISCRSGTCIAVGSYAYGIQTSRPMWTTESKGQFGPGKPVTAKPANAGPVPDPVLWGISCPPIGPCVSVGNYIDSTGHGSALYMTRSSGKWRAFTLLPPPNAASGDGQVGVGAAVSCVGAERCTAVGYYHDIAGNWRAQAWSGG